MSTDAYANGFDAAVIELLDACFDEGVPFDDQDANKQQVLRLMSSYVTN